MSPCPELECSLFPLQSDHSLYQYLFSKIPNLYCQLSSQVLSELFCLYKFLLTCSIGLLFFQHIFFFFFFFRNMNLFTNNQKHIFWRMILCFAQFLAENKYLFREKTLLHCFQAFYYEYIFRKAGSCVWWVEGWDIYLQHQIFNRIAEIRLKLPLRSHFESVLFIQ